MDHKLDRRAGLSVSNVDIIQQGSDEAVQQIQPKIRKYILDNFLFGGKEGALENDRSFLDSGIIDSTGILEIINYIEDEFGIKVQDEEIVPENLDSVALISRYISRKIAG